jgi:hypothetical protein
MLTQALSCVLLVGAIAPGLQSGAWSQAVPAKEGSMLIPPPVSIEAYPKEVGSEVRSNYLRAGVTVSAGYIDNLYAGSGNAVLGETTVSVRPKIAFDATSSRQQTTLLYSPGFTFYLPTSELNQTDQNAIFNWRFRVTPHGTITANDIFQQGSSSFSASSLGAVSGSAPASAVGIIAPFAQRLTNAVDAQYALQFNPTNMVGITGRRFDLHYPDAAEVPGLYDSNEWGGGGFYSHRLTGAQYVGTTYRYSRILASPQDASSETQTHTIFLFYTIYLKRGLSFSVSSGPQEFNAEATFLATATPAAGVRNRARAASTGSLQSADAQTQTVTTSSWSPGVTASMGWQENHTNFSVSYAKSVTAGGGLLGTFDSNSASAAARWRASRTWTLAVSATYSILKSVAPLPFFSTTLGGHSIGGVATADHPLSEHIGVSFEYDRLHQSYAGITALVSNPNSDRGMVSVYWQFARPIGR